MFICHSLEKQKKEASEMLEKIIIPLYSILCLESAICFHSEVSARQRQLFGALMYITGSCFVLASKQDAPGHNLGCSWPLASG